MYIVKTLINLSTSCVAETVIVLSSFAHSRDLMSWDATLGKTPEYVKARGCNLDQNVFTTAEAHSVPQPTFKNMVEGDVTGLGGAFSWTWLTRDFRIVLL